MSYFPTSVPSAVAATNRFAALAARMQLGRLSPTTETTASFVVPAVGATVTVPVAASSGFLDGDYVVVGTQFCILNAPVHATSGAGTLTFTGFMPGGWVPGTLCEPTGINMMGLGAGGNTTITLAPAATWTMPNAQSPTSVTLTLADRAQVPSGGRVLVTNHAGLFRVEGAPPSPTSLLLRLVRRGDLDAGMTCIQDQSYTGTGTAVSMGYPLLPLTDDSPYQFFYPADGWYKSVVANFVGATTPAISVGCFPNAESGRARFGQFASAQGLVAGSAFAPDNYRKLTLASDTSQQRIGVPPNLTLMACVTTAANLSGVGPLDYQIDLCIRGFFAR